MCGRGSGRPSYFEKWDEVPIFNKKISSDMKQNWDVCVRCLYLIYGHAKSPFYKSPPKELRIRVVLLYRGGWEKTFWWQSIHIYTWSWLVEVRRSRPLLFQASMQNANGRKSSNTINSYLKNKYIGLGHHQKLLNINVKFNFTIESRIKPVLAIYSWQFNSMIIQIEFTYVQCARCTSQSHPKICFY